MTDHLKSIRDPAKVENFIVGANDAIAEWLVSYSQQPTKSKKGDVGKLDKLHDRLREVESAINSLGSVSDYFWLKMTERVVVRKRDMRDPATDDIIKVVGPVMQNERDATQAFVLRIFSDLAGLAADLRVELANTNGLANERKIVLVKGLILSYLASIQRTPSSTRNGIFMNVMGEVANILAVRKVQITIGEDVVKTALNEMSTTIGVFEKYR